MSDNLPPLPPACGAETLSAIGCGYTEDDMQAYARAAIEASRAAVPAGWKLAPDWKGYALLGTGHYVINHTADFDEKLGAELLITTANEEDRSGNRQIGESRDVTDPKPIEPDQMVIRIGFLNERGLFALEDQLRYIRKLHFPAAPQPVAQPGEALAPANNYIQSVPDHCDRIVWRGHYHHLPVTQAKPEQAAQQWQPIETAPTSEKVLLFSPDFTSLSIGYWAHYSRQNHPNFTHWMHLPASPTPKD